MATGYPETLQNLIEALGRLPGIGERSAERLAIYLLKADGEEALGLAEAIREVKAKLMACRACFNFSADALCPICSDDERDARTIMVVEGPKDLVAFERLGRYRGLYHVLMGHLSPHEGSAMSHLTTDRLLERVRAGGVDEVILATNPNAEGDGTALALARRLEGTGVRVTRLARGLPSGFSIEYAGTEILADALDGRRSSPPEEARGG
ncbi:MAG: recombination protein RecR [Deltaproteobacteria bacterium]|jgi:recombination protein RecR|nr:recombination protein RecR [Deltaproteobacteria bacterium]